LEKRGFYHTPDVGPTAAIVPDRGAAKIARFPVSSIVERVGTPS